MLSGVQRGGGGPTCGVPSSSPAPAARSPPGFGGTRLAREAAIAVAARPRAQGGRRRRLLPLAGREDGAPLHRTQVWEAGAGVLAWLEARHVHRQQQRHRTEAEQPWPPSPAPPRCTLLVVLEMLALLTPAALPSSPVHRAFCLDGKEMVRLLLWCCQLVWLHADAHVMWPAAVRRPTCCRCRLATAPFLHTLLAPHPLLLRFPPSSTTTALLRWHRVHWQRRWRQPLH